MDAMKQRIIEQSAGWLRSLKEKPELLREEKYVQLIDRGREIQREVVYAHYPLKIAGRWVTPMEYYTQEKARRIIDDARFVVDGIKTYLEEKRLKRNPQTVFRS